ncbi:MAG TPA: peptide chain release factor N(5)-glutamine methyltransferase [Steroidobacteraceae bacterium]|nr:peptide chain release factor N(5)-glutamine methyltransferase [Steroidobacteraceae bacterium]
MSALLTTAELLRRGTRQLATGDSEVAASAVLDAEVLLAHVLGIGRARLRSHPETPCDASTEHTYAALLARRAAGEPLAYLIGHREFWSLRLIVSPAVLVPRPETELLVERALSLCPERQARVADLGTGSGAIALALARERPHWQIVATDLAADALAIARANARQLQLANLEFRLGSWLAPLAGERFALLLSNPPYVADTDPLLAAAPLRYEPSGALTPGTDGLAALRQIIHDAPLHLARGGWLALEHGATQAADVARALVVRGFGHVRSHRDLAGHERVTEARWERG